MLLPDGRPVVVADGTLPEPIGAGGRIVLWLRGDRVGNYRNWERIGTVPHAGVTSERGVRATAAASVPARQWVGGPIGRALRGLAAPRPERRWDLPDGSTAEQCGARRTDLVLAWSEDESAPLDEARIRSRWGGAPEVRPIGGGLYLVSGVGSPRPQAPSASGSADQGTPRELAERALALARASGDGRREVTALADLGLACLRERDFRRAEESLAEAIAGARRIGDRAREAGALIDLGQVALAAGRPGEARTRLGQGLASARAAGDRHAEKLALDRLAQAHADLGDPSGAVASWGQALAIAEELGDGQHRSEVLWRIGIQHAELGHHDRAAVAAQAAVEGMRRLGWPQAEWYARHLAEFRSGGPASRPSPPVGAGLDLVSSIDTNSPPDPRRGTGPGPLRMALTAVDSMVKFVGSGFRAPSPDDYRARVEACAACEHHTGLRCRVCGCFTAAKARVGHERCPAGKWRT